MEKKIEDLKQSFTFGVESTDLIFRPFCLIASEGPVWVVPLMWEALRESTVKQRTIVSGCQPGLDCFSPLRGLALVVYTTSPFIFSKDIINNRRLNWQRNHCHYFSLLKSQSSRLKWVWVSYLSVLICCVCLCRMLWLPWNPCLIPVKVELIGSIKRWMWKICL